MSMTAPKFFLKKARWSALLSPLPQEQENNSQQQRVFSRKRARLYGEIIKLKKQPSPEMTEKILAVLKSPYRRSPLLDREEGKADPSIELLQKPSSRFAYNRHLVAALLFKPLHKLPVLDPVFLMPWTAPFIAVAITGQAMISTSDNEEQTLHAMDWAISFAKRMSLAANKKKLVGGEAVWKKVWLPLLAFNITAIDYYSTNANMAPFVRFFGRLRAQAFGLLPAPKYDAPLRVLGDLPPCSVQKNRPKRLALFCSHMTAHGHGLPHLLWWITCLNRKRFEPLVVVQETPTNADRLEKFFARYPRLSKMVPIVIVSENALLNLRKLNIDVLYNMDDLCRGLSERSAYLRLAKTQVTGFYTPATTGCNKIDYYITSPDLDPYPDDAFTEKAIMSQGIPFCLHYESYFGITPLLTRKDIGISKKAVVLSMGASMTTKLRPAFVDALVQILKRVPEAFCIGMPVERPQDRPHLVALLLKTCEKHGVDPNRVLFYKVADRYFLHGLIQMSDLFLDFFPFSGTNNLLDPLAVGTPCITLCPPEGYSRNRIGAAILRSLKLDALIAETPQEYVDLAVSLCCSPEKRKKFSAKMGRKKIEASPLCDGPAYVKRMEDVFAKLVCKKEGRA